MIAMPHIAEVFRPTFVQGTDQQISGYESVYSDVPCFIQPVDVKEATFYEQRGQEGVASVYTTDMTSVFKRNDIWESQGEEFHVVGIKPALFLGIYRELTVYWYPEGAKKRLSMGAYQ